MLFRSLSQCRVSARAPGHHHGIADPRDLPADINLVAVAHQWDVIADDLDIAVKAVTQFLGDQVEALVC